MARLGDVCNKITDGSHNPPAGIATSEYMMLSSKNIEDDNITYTDPRYLDKSEFETENRRTQISSGDLLMTIVGTVGRVAVVDCHTRNICLQRSVAVLKPKAETVDSRFLMYQIQSMRQLIESESHGVAQKGIYLSQVEQLPIVLPNLPTQRRIAATLDKVSKGIALCKQMLADLDELVKSQFVEMFENGDYPLIEAGTIMFNMRNGLSPSTKGTYHEKVLTLTAITQGWFDPEQWKDGAFNICPPNEKRISSSEFYICRGNGNRTLVGAGVISTEDRADLVFPDTVIAAQVDERRICLPYLYHAWKQPSVRDQIESAARTTNGTYKINQGIISKVRFVLPPIGAQKIFVTIAEQADKSKLAVQQQLAELETLKKSLMQEYFQ